MTSARPALAAILLLATSVVHAADMPRTRVPIAGPESSVESGAARDIIALIDQLSAAMQGRDTRTLARVLLPDAALTASRGAAAAIERKTAAEFIAQIGAAKEPIDERIGRADITIADGVAAAAAPYRFYIGGKLHHCGTDFFQLVDTPSGWRIAAIAYNATTEDCAP